MESDQAKSVWSRLDSNFFYLPDCVHHFKSYIFQKAFLKYGGHKRRGRASVWVMNWADKRLPKLKHPLSFCARHILKRLKFGSKDMGNWRVAKTIRNKRYYVFFWLYLKIYISNFRLILFDHNIYVLYCLFVFCLFVCCLCFCFVFVFLFLFCFCCFCF